MRSLWKSTRTVPEGVSGRGEGVSGVDRRVEGGGREQGHRLNSAGHETSKADGGDSVPMFSIMFFVSGPHGSQVT